jgi:hypothetical protein
LFLQYELTLDHLGLLLQKLRMECGMSPQVKAAEVVRLANEAESAKRKAERARQEENELQARCPPPAAPLQHCCLLHACGTIAAGTVWWL